MSKEDKIKPDGTVDYRARRKKHSPKPNDLRYKRKIWAKLESETREEFSKFIKFRDLDPDDRDYEEFLRVRDFDRAEIDELWARNNWQERIEAWDNSTARRLAYRQARAAEKMRANHATVGSNMLGVALVHVRKWAARPADEEPMSVGNIVQLARAGVEMERLARDMPTEITESRGDGEIDKSKLSLSDLKKLKEIRKKVQVKGE